MYFYIGSVLSLQNYYQVQKKENLKFVEQNSENFLQILS